MSLVKITLLAAIPAVVVAGGYGHPAPIPDNCVTTSTCDRITITSARPTITVGLDKEKEDEYCNEYEYVVEEFCSTGLQEKTYTVTETCTLPVCERPTGPPPGFTTTVTVCDSCGDDVITATLTVPVGPKPTGGDHGGNHGGNGGGNGSDIPSKPTGPPSKPVVVSSAFKSQPMVGGLLVAGLTMALALF